MTKLKIRITEFDPVVKRGRFFIDKEQTVFLYEFNKEDFFEILEVVGKIVNSGRKGGLLSEEQIKKIREMENIDIEDRPIGPSPV